MRVYKTAKSIWGFGISHSSEGWHFQIAKWIFTTAPE
jgi:hypothetical protein